MYQSNSFGNVQGQSPAVEFIDERLPQHDPAFLNAHSVFDNASGRYIPLNSAQWNQNISSQFSMTNLAVIVQAHPDQGAVPDQNHPNDVEEQAMRFWEDLFAEAMKLLTTESEEPKLLTKSGGGIRSACEWEQVCSRLNEAQITYVGEEGASGMLKRMRRKVADNLSQPAAHVTKMVPDVEPWVTPVVGTIGLLLQAVSTAAKTRQEVLTNLADLEKTFSNINSFAATFPRDDNVRQASITLVVAIFQAVEHAIAFFVKSSGRKVAAAILTGTEYQKELLNSFDEVQKRSDYLIQKARNSHYEDTRVAMLEILSREDRLLAGQVEIARDSAEMKNCLYGLMQVYVRERELDRQQHREELSRRDEIQKQQDAMHRRDRQELLALVRQLQISPRPASPLLPNPTRPLPPPASTHTVFIPSFPVWTAQALLQLLCVPDISASDLLRVKALESTLSRKYKEKADWVVKTGIFTQWMRSLKPAKLLIQGSFRGSRTLSPLCLLTATLTEAARADQQRFVSLVFFCSCHTDREEDTFSGGRALIQVLISQLLQQQPHMNISASPWELNVDLVRQGHLQQLCQLLSLLVHRLPGELTLFCLIDGMVYYERDEFIGETQYVLTEITRLVGDPTIEANVKLLITSPWRTSMAQNFFQEDHEVLHMEGVPSVGLTPSASRVIRRHISHTESHRSSRDSSPDVWE